LHFGTNEFLVVARRAVWLSAATLTVGIIGGCAERPPKTYPVILNVTYPDSKPVVGAQVVLRSDDGKSTARGEVGNDGSCQLTTTKPNDGAVLGHHMVMVAKPPLKGDPDVPYRGPQIADKFANFTTSGLEITVTEDASKNSFPITVTPR
jgi:hypothetical protein